MTDKPGEYDIFGNIRGLGMEAAKQRREAMAQPLPEAILEEAAKRNKNEHNNRIKRSLVPCDINF